MTSGTVLDAHGINHAGRAPNDKVLVREPSSQGHVWWGSVTRAVRPDPCGAWRELVREAKGFESEAETGAVEAGAR